MWPADQALLSLPREQALLGGSRKTQGGIAWISGEGASHFLRFFLTVCTPLLSMPWGVRGRQERPETDGHLGSLQGLPRAAHQEGCSAKGRSAAEPWTWKGESLPPGQTALRSLQGRSSLSKADGRSRHPSVAHSSPGALTMPLCASLPSMGLAFHPNLGCPPKPSSQASLPVHQCRGSSPEPTTAFACLPESEFLALPPTVQSS